MGALFFNFSSFWWSLCEWSRGRSSTDMDLNTGQYVTWEIGSTAIAVFQLQHQDSLIRDLSGEYRIACVAKQWEICCLTKCYGRTSCLPSPRAMYFGRDPQQRWVMESSRSFGRKHLSFFTWLCQVQQSMEKSNERWLSNQLCVNDLCTSHAFRFCAQQPGAAEHCHPLRLQQDDHWFWWFCCLHDPLRDPFQ